MRILILGATGFVGGHLVRRLSRDGHSVTLATRHAPGARRLGAIPRTQIRQFDLYDTGRLAGELDRHDALINLVGILNESGRDGSEFRRVHVELVESAIEACHRAGVRRFVHMSALRAGDGESFYLKTRGEAEQRVRDSRLDWTMFRPSTIFGPDDSFLNRFSSLLAITPVLPLARADAKMAPVFVDDVVDAYAVALEDRSSFGQVYELCGPEVWTLREIVDWIIEQRGICRKVVSLPDGLGRLQGRVLDFVPGKPFSSDNFKSLLIDSVCSDNGFERLGLEPTAMSEKAPEWLASNARQSRCQRFRNRAGRR